MKKEYVGLIATACVILVVLSSIIIYNQWPFLTGKKLVLATQPVDPFDPFRGQYMTINYEISRVENPTALTEGDTIYILLKEDTQGIWRKEGVSKSRPDKGDFIKGSVTSTSGTLARVEYGIEQFFFERHASLPTTNITVEAIVDNSGRAKIVQLLHDGKPIEIQYETFDIQS